MSTKMIEKNQKITNFWEWFISNQKEFTKINELNQKKIHNEINKKLNNIKKGLSIEITEKFQDKRFLIISANGDFDNFNIVEEIVEQAPYMEEWDVLDIRQDSEDDLSLNDSIIDNNIMDLVPSDLFFYPIIDESYLDIIIYGKNFKSYDKSMLTHYGLILLDSLLGTNDSATKIRFYDFQDLNKKKENHDLKPLTELPMFIDSFYNAD